MPGRDDGTVKEPSREPHEAVRGGTAERDHVFESCDTAGDTVSGSAGQERCRPAEHGRSGDAGGTCQALEAMVPGEGGDLDVLEEEADALFGGWRTVTAPEGAGKRILSPVFEQLGVEREPFAPPAVVSVEAERSLLGRLIEFLLAPAAVGPAQACRAWALSIPLLLLVCNLAVDGITGTARLQDVLLRGAALSSAETGRTSDAQASKETFFADCANDVLHEMAMRPSDLYGTVLWVEQARCRVRRQ